MNNQFYLELGKKCKEMSSKTIRKEMINKIIYAYDRTLHFSNVGRTDGILMMEELAAALPEEGCDGYFKYLITLIIDGTEPELVEEMGFMRYLTDTYQSEDSFICLMYLKGALLIQEGELPRRVSEYLKSFLPVAVRQAIYEREMANRLSPEEECAERINQLIADDSVIDSSKYPILEQLASVVIHLSDHDVQVVLNHNHTAFSDWIIVMKAFPGSVRKRVFNNCSLKMSKELIFMMDCMGPIRMANVEETARIILICIAWLMEMHEIDEVELESIKIITE